MKLRDMKQGRCGVTSVDVAGIGDNPGAWLADRARAHGLTTLLAHADDGVIWGKVTSDSLVTSDQLFPAVSPPLRMPTLQKARLFGPQAELLVWQQQGQWAARLVQDGSGDTISYYDDVQLLWGNQHRETKGGFTLVAEGQQGLNHAPPLEVPRTAFAPSHHPLRLRLRHYLKADSETGLLRIDLSRLMAVQYASPGESKEVQS